MVRDIRPPYTVLRVALVDIGTNKTVRLLENMLLRCVGFSWAKLSVTKSSTHPSVYSVKTHAVLFTALSNPDIRRQVSVANETVNRGAATPWFQSLSNPLKSRFRTLSIPSFLAFSFCVFCVFCGFNPSQTL